jgi:hypothetical protein
LTENSIEQWTEATRVLLEVCGLIDEMRREVRQESMKAIQSINRSNPYELLIEALSTLAELKDDPDLRRLTFETVERAKARSLVESIALEAQTRARESGFELGGITHYLQDEREKLPRLSFGEIVEMLESASTPGED